MAVFHPQEIGPGARKVKACWFLPALALLLPLLPACESDPIPPETGRFGQVGEIRVDVQTPLLGGEGRLEGILVWESSGRWILAERLFYRGREGDQTLLTSRRNPGELAQEYASLIAQLNETPGLRLLGEVDPTLEPGCVPPRSRVEVTLVDDPRSEIVQWSRCAEGNLFSITPGSAGPDPEAARVVTAAQLVRSFTIGDQTNSAFQATLPFGSLAVGEDSPARPGGSRAFVSDDGTAPAEWITFWEAHSEGATSAPDVDWDREIILLVAVGRRDEAGHRVRTRRVLPVGTATQVEVVEEVPGDFCSPAARTRYPFHIVVAPLAPLPVIFSDPVQQRVPCG